MRRTSRLFEIIQLLRSAKKPLTAAAIAETLEVTKRTVYRDVASLQAMSVPIYGEAGVGYVMRPGYDLPPLMLCNYSPPHRDAFLLLNQQLTPISSRCRVESNCRRDVSRAASCDATLVVSSGTLLV